METISVVISAYNEETKIKRCLNSLKWADEIIFVDNGSTDKTVAIAKQFTSKIVYQPNSLMLNINKNYGFSKATGDWILSLDADEEITQELAAEIRSNIKQTKPSNTPEAAGYWIPRKNIIFGKWIQHGLWWPDKQLRIFRRGRGKFPCKHVHEYLAVDGPTEDLTSPYIHYNYETVSQFIRKMDTLYTESEMQNLLATNYHLSWYDAIRFPVSDFVKIYFAQEGYKDGLHGLVLSMFQSFYSFVVFAKLWEKEKFTERDVPLSSVCSEIARSHQEISYWSLTARMKDTPRSVKKLWYKLLRRYVARYT